jgi:hypothetical protein
MVFGSGQQMIAFEQEAVYVNTGRCSPPAIPVHVPRPRYIAFGILVTKDVIPEEPEIINSCDRCGQLLIGHILNSNYYCEGDGRI